MRLPVAAWLVLIAFETTDLLSSANTHRLLFPLFHYVTGIGFREFAPWNHVLRKAGHCLGYGMLCALIYRMTRYELRRLRMDPRPARAASLALLGTMVVASLDEWHQTMIPSRTGTVADVVLDSAAGLMALTVIFLVRGLRASRVSRGTVAEWRQPAPDI